MYAIRSYYGIDSSQLGIDGTVALIEKIVAARDQASLVKERTDDEKPEPKPWIWEPHDQETE